MKTRLAALSLVFVASSWLPLRAANEIGFIEKFAIASDREAVLKELIPGTEEYYFYHALHFQNTGKQKELDEVITQWSKRTPGSLLLREIRNRNALLNYEKDPAATIAYLKSVVGVSFNHFQQTLNPKPDLPVKVDDKWIAQDLFVKEALRDPNQLGGVTNDGLKLLVEIKAPLSGPQRRQLLSRVDRP